MIQVHGGNVYRHADILDFSANINPLGLAPSIKTAVTEQCDMWERYPDPYCTQLVKAISEKENFPCEQIVCGNGAADLIYRIVHSFKAKQGVVCAPSFGEYEKGLLETGCNIHRYYLKEEQEFALDEEFTECIRKGVDIVFICTPNNPTGQVIAPQLLEKIAKKCLDTGAVLVCDGCFLEFVTEWETYSLKKYLNENCIMLNAFTKYYAMAGLRLGYALCGSRKIADRLWESGQYWSVSAPAQTAGIAAIKERDFYKGTAELVKGEREFLAGELESAGMRVYRSEANFILFKAEKGLFDKFLALGILVRDCSSFHGLGAGYYRIAVRTHRENQVFTKALRRVNNG